jgi:16S rRNA (cytosine1402-N4)-methyltransferase
MAESASIHVPVLLEAVLRLINPQPGMVIVDGTLGGGGHTRELLDMVGASGMVIAIDRDPDAIDRGEKEFKGKHIRLAQANYCDLPEVLRQLEIHSVDGVIMDLGVSSDQLADAGRGFSFSLEGPLDLRFDPSSGEPARRLINRLSAEHLAELIFGYGEERFSRRIARAIVQQRRNKPIDTSLELAELIRRVVPKSARGERIDPATRTFQALRIAVNEELKSLEIGLRRIPDCLRPGAVMAVISFHSLEDRQVKESFRGDPRLKNLTAKPIRPEAAEIQRNPRCRSAKLRAAQRV